MTAAINSSLSEFWIEQIKLTKNEKNQKTVILEKYLDVQAAINQGKCMPKLKICQ